MIDRISFALLKFLSLCLLFSGAEPQCVVAQNAFWINNTGGFYTDISNWSPMAVPTAANDLIFQFPGDYRVDMLDNRAANQIDVIDNAGITLDLHVAAAGVGAVFDIAADVSVIDSELTIGDSSGGKWLLLDVGGNLDITGFANDPTRGSLTVNNDGILNTGNAVLGNGSGRFGWARVTGTNAEWDMTGAALSVGSIVGNGGGGQLVVENGGEFNAVSIEMGLSHLSPDDSDRGELIVSGVGGDGLPSTVNLSAGMRIGVAGRGSLTVNGGGQVTMAGQTDVGDNLSGGEGFVEISGTDAAGNPSAWQMGNLFVDETGTTNGMRFLDGASVTTNGQFGIALGEISLAGVSAVDGTPTTWEVTGNMQIAVDSGDIDIEDGARLVAGSVELAVGSSAGSLLLRDSTPGRISSLEVAGDAFIGGTDTTLGGAANFQVGTNTKATIGGTFKLWSNAFFELEGDFFAGEIDVTDAGANPISMTSGSLSFDTYQGDLLVENVVVSPGLTTSSATIFGEYEQEPTATLRFDVNGALPGAGFDQLTVSGNAELDGTLALTLGPGITPDPNDTFIVLGSAFLSGTFDNIASGGRLTTLDGLGSFIVNYGLGSPFGANQIVLSDFMPELSGDFDVDGDVDGADFLSWQRGESPNPWSASDLQSWETNFGATASQSAASRGVPEPATLLLAIAILLGVPVVRRSANQRAELTHLA